MNAIRSRITDCFNFPPDPLRKKRLTKAIFDAALTVSCVALLAIYSPPFRLGVAIQTPLFAAKIILAKIFIKGSQQTREEAICTKNETVKIFYNRPSNIGCIGMPILEEFIFRGVILSALQNAMNHALPAITFQIATLPPIAIATTISVIFSSVIFGLVHYSNNYTNHKILHVINSFAGGIFYSILTINYGLISAIGAHVINNTVAILTLKTSIVIAGPEEYINNPIYE